MTVDVAKLRELLASRRADVADIRARAAANKPIAEARAVRAKEQG